MAGIEQLKGPPRRSARTRILPPWLSKFHHLGGSWKDLGGDVIRTNFSGKRRHGHIYDRDFSGDRRLPILEPVDADKMLFQDFRLETPDGLEEANHFQHLGAHMVRGFVIS